MKKLMLALIAFVASAGTMQAQDIAGTWQGMVQPANAPNPLRIVMKLSKEAEQFKAVLYSIDQGGQPINAADVSFKGSVLKFTLPTIGGSYEGRLSADGNSITGTFTQGMPTPLNLVRTTPQTAWAIPEPPPQPKPMAATANLVFEVATIKPANPENRGSSFLVGRGGGNMLTTTNTTVNDLIAMAYGIHASQIVDGPAWLASDKFDIVAKPEEAGTPNVTQLQAMVKRMLTDRFGLAFHTEKRELTAYVIAVAKNGPKLTKNETGGNLPGFGGRGPGAIGARNSTMAEFAAFLQSRLLDRAVVDQTGLTDKYDFTLEFRPDPMLQPQGGGPAPELSPEVAARSDLFTAVQEQLGLRIQTAKTSVPVYVIDKVQKPSN